MGRTKQTKADLMCCTGNFWKESTKGSLNPLVAGNEQAFHREADKWPVYPGRDAVCRKMHVGSGVGHQGY